ncbi:putative toxin-antitoxin system toxin component, PIN family [filamentous cyanobacterium LEGE 11480]|uniref:Toxin-antitoxin system toxin component, PIN family n=1 Tax=Romeriopsis navalis LEGE 11480 TaxID=2777977 RepID=A0A928VS50_9CYAN|nr:putative toxin-antitoxin system toxin component, PIN family [Romeriopsis navalis]MBE9031184.1 putative toxin-antitoxin system toxin component, PIN family [Romeriopsis navalis LEGE 11480]
MSPNIVVDTSVFISALIGPQGPSRDLIRACFNGVYHPLMGTALFAEYEAVMQRAEILRQCPLSTTEIEELLAAFLNVSEWVNIYYLWRPNLRDEADNHVIELAVAGNAKVIVTNNVRDFQATELTFPDLSILKPEQLLQR